MRAARLSVPTVVEVVDVPAPTAGTGEVIVQVGGAGVCHSDVHVAHMLALPFPTPFTLGHEIAGTVVEGPATGPAAVRTPVVVHLCWSCGECRACAAGQDNVCEAAGRVAQPPCPGLGTGGGMAEYVRVPARDVIPAHDLDLVAAAPLADAGLTPMHAVRNAADHLRPDAIVLVIGVGGLGHVAIQLLRAMTAIRIVAVDTRPERVAAAEGYGADVALQAGPDVADAILGMTAGRGAEVVLDFAGTQDTVDLPVGTVAPNGVYRLVGILGGQSRITAEPATGLGWPWGASLRRLEEGGIAGRAVLVP